MSWFSAFVTSKHLLGRLVGTILRDVPGLLAIVACLGGQPGLKRSRGGKVDEILGQLVLVDIHNAAFALEPVVSVLQDLRFGFWSILRVILLIWKFLIILFYEPVVGVLEDLRFGFWSIRRVILLIRKILIILDLVLGFGLHDSNICDNDDGRLRSRQGNVDL